MLIEKLLAAGWASYGTVMTVVLGRNAVAQITGAAHLWAGHISSYLSWGQ